MAEKGIATTCALAGGTPTDSSVDDTSRAAMLLSAFTAMVLPASCWGAVIPDPGSTTISSTLGAPV